MPVARYSFPQLIISGVSGARVRSASRIAQSKVVSVMARLKVLYGFHAVTARLRHDASTVEEVYYDATRNHRLITASLPAARQSGTHLIAAHQTRIQGLS